MSMFGRFLGGHSRNSSKDTTAGFQDELAALSDAMRGAAFMMDDDMETAEAELSKSNSAFHKLGLGVAGFLQAVLGFEKDMMKDASDKLAAAESSAWDAHRQAQRRSVGGPKSAIYTPGSEYMLCVAEVQIMAAVIAVLTESLTESIKGFYKLSKANAALDAIVQQEKAYMKSRGFDPSAQSSANASKVSLTAASGSGPNTVASSQTAYSSDSDDFVDAAEDGKGAGETQHYEGHLSTDTSAISKDLDQMTLKDRQSVEQPPLRRLSSKLENGPDLDFFGGNEMDMFIHSGSNMCYGILLVLLSLVPPSFATLLRIVGFAGDRKRGLELLWQATKFHNINGAFAGLVLLGYYNGMMGFTDIQPSSGKGAYPKERCKALLVDFRQRYPNSRLWLLEEARTMSSEKQLEEAVHMLETVPESKLKQVLALQWFERSLNNMYLHRYEKCSEAFLKMIELNKWSHGLYYYIAGISLVEEYREVEVTDPEAAAKIAERAEKLLRTVPDHVGKRKIIGKQLPFDMFVSRKLLKWDERAKERGCSFIDAIGICPIEEMIYFWNGFKKMPTKDLEVSLSKLTAWSDPARNPTWASESMDEQAVCSTLIAVVLRNMGKTAESRKMLKDEVLRHQWAAFKGGNKDNWPLPVATYEMAVNCWQDYGTKTGDEAAQLKECMEYLEKVAAWEAFDMDTRFGVRITTAKDTVKREQGARSFTS